MIRMGKSLKANVSCGEIYEMVGENVILVISYKSFSCIIFLINHIRVKEVRYILANLYRPPPTLHLILSIRDCDFHS